MAKIDQAHLRDTADRMIDRWGEAGILRRATGDRPCTVAISTYSPMERLGSLRNPIDRKAIISAKGLDVPPDQEQDRLIVNGENLRITEPPKQNGTGDIVVYWTMSVRR